MSNSIKTYDDLLQEEQRLVQVLKGHEAVIKEDLAGLREGLKPVRNALNVLNRMATRDKTGPLMNFGIDFSIDLFLRRLLLARAGWFTKIVVPFVVKNYSSHIISDEQKAKLAKKVQDIFNKIRPKPDRRTPEEEEQKEAAT
jgi:hypothetical protein